MQSGQCRHRPCNLSPDKTRLANRGIHTCRTMIHDALVEAQKAQAGRRRPPGQPFVRVGRSTQQGYQPCLVPYRRPKEEERTSHALSNDLYRLASSRACLLLLNPGHYVRTHSSQGGLDIMKHNVPDVIFFAAAHRKWRGCGGGFPLLPVCISNNNTLWRGLCRCAPSPSFALTTCSLQCVPLRPSDASGVIERTRP